ncbi:MAG: glycosyltransferase [Candidatus Omnitrophica bacterium]|nr:glycosyltransferase [Candidatus Omnitrophota bacterium]
MNVALIYDELTKRCVGNYVAAALRELGVPFTHFWTREAYAIPDTFDLYFRVDEGIYEYDIPSYLRPSAYWPLDTHLKYPYKKITKIAARYDVVFCPQKSDVENLKRVCRRVRWIPVGCDPRIHNRVDVKEEYDVGFVGTDGGVPRKFYLQEIRERYPHSFIGMIDHTRMNEVYSRSKIGFQYIRSYFTNKSVITQRLFEIAACGAMILTNHGEEDALAQLGFIDRKNMVVYHNAHELFHSITYYLTHDEERRRIADAGHRLVMQEHTYVRRVAEMLGYIDKHISKQ